MPIFTIKDNESGRVFKIRGDSPPTEAEMNEIFSTANKPVEKKDSQYFTPTPYGVGGGVNVSPQPDLTERTEDLFRYGVPGAIALGTGGTSLLVQAGLNTLANVAGETAARAISRKDITSAESVAEIGKAGIFGAIPLRRAAKVLETAAVSGGGSALAESFGQLVKQNLTSEDGIAKSKAEDQVIQSGILGTVLGGGFSAGGRTIGKMTSFAKESENVRSFLDKIGIKSPALSQIVPEYAPITNRMAARDPQLQEKLVSTESNITQEIFDIIGNIPTNSQVATKVAPLIETANKTKVRLDESTAQYTAAKAKIAALEAAPAQSSKFQEEYENAALEQLAAVRREAAAKFSAQQNFGSAASISSHADDLTKTIVRLDGAVSDVSTALYSKTGLNGADEIVSRDDLLRSAYSSLGDQAESPIGRQIINAIKTVGTIDDQVPELLSWNQFKNLRDEMSSKWASFDENYVGRAEALAGNVYKNMGGTLKESIKARLGPENAKAFDAAQTFWYNWSQTRDSNFTRSIFHSQRRVIDGEVASGVTVPNLEQIASGILKGDIQSVRNIVGGINLVGTYSPEVANEMRASVGRAMNGAMIDKHINDPAGLIIELAKQSNKPDVVPFIQFAGFPDKEKLDQLAVAVRKYDKKDLTPAVMEQAFTAGDSALGLASGVVKQKVGSAALLAVAGNTQKSRELLASARELAKKNNLSFDEANRVYNETINNPLFSIFTGKGNYKFSEEAGKVGPGTISHFLMTVNPDSAYKFMGALREKDPEFANLVSRKILADELYRFSGVDRQAKDASTKVDFDKLRRMFKPVLPQDVERSKHLKLIVGDVFEGRMKQFLTAFEKATPLLKQAKLIKQDASAPVSSTGAGIAQAFLGLPGFSALGASVLASRLGKILDQPRFDLLTYMATDPDFVRRMNKFSDFSSGISSLPVQKGYLYLANSGLAADMADADANQPALPQR